MYSDERGLGAVLTLEQQAKADEDALTQRMLGTLRSGKFATPEGGQQLPEIVVHGSPWPFYVLLAVVLFFAFGDRKGGSGLW